MSHGTKIEAVATAIADSIDLGAVGFPWQTIVDELVKLLPTLLVCMMAEESPDPHEATTILKRLNERHPIALLHRTQRAVRADAISPMTRTQASILAASIIQHALTMDTVAVLGCWNEVTA